MNNPRVITTRLEQTEARSFAKACEMAGRSMSAELRRLAVAHVAEFMAQDDGGPDAGGAGSSERRGDGAHAVEA